MKASRRRPAGWALLAALFFSVCAFALQVPPRPLGRVSDFAGLLSPQDRGAIEARLEQIEASNSNQFAVAIFQSLEGESLEDFSIRLADAWKVGHKGRDNGLLLLIFVEDRKVRIEVGKGLEGAITDALSGRVIRDILAPRFRSGDYAGGILAAVEALDAASRGEFTALPAAGRDVPRLLTWLGPIVLFLLFWIVVSRLNRPAYFGGRGHRREPPWWMGPGGGFGGGGFGGGLGGGFGGGGGFSGGGGSFGGGGASGRW